ncbi:MAG TPA: hypothetical protein VKJ65_07365 [Phycisphaerae bacterium]|nr:hypothetical protein [Phycisphaerae bacterium]
MREHEHRTVRDVRQIREDLDRKSTSDQADQVEFTSASASKD